MGVYGARKRLILGGVPGSGKTYRLSSDRRAARRKARSSRPGRGLSSGYHYRGTKHLTRTRILIADDEANMRITLADILEDEGYEVTTVANGEEAMAMCSETRFAVILMDVRMPGIDGVEAFRRLRQYQAKEGSFLG